MAQSQQRCSTAISIVGSQGSIDRLLLTDLSPSTAAEHVFSENSIAVREDEPTSIIAFTLKCVQCPAICSRPWTNSRLSISSKDHKNAMYKAKAERHAQTPERSSSISEDAGMSPSAWSVINKEDIPAPAELLKHPGSVTHLSFREYVFKIDYMSKLILFDRV